MDLPKFYSPTEVEDKIYEQWEASGYFNPDKLKLSEDAPVFSLMMPPPNVTGVLHLGHALENTIMDSEIRYQRMRGKRTLLLPGTDHAAVATQARVEKELINSGKYKNPRQELGREKLLEIIREYSENSKATILKQIRKMGTSCDWGRLAYTFDEPREKAVNEMFVRMYNDGLIYRGYRVVNWSVKGQSTLSDDELEYKEQAGKLYTFKYSADFPIPIATTRPETKLGDTAVAVNPDDPRYEQYIGVEFEVEVGAKKPLQIKIIADDAVDPAFGTGALGVTPAHSQIDFEMKEKHGLELIPVINQYGRMTEEAGPEYAGLKVLEAREKFVNYLKENNLLIKEEEITQNVGTSDRFGDVVEVVPMLQWFVNVNKKIPGRGTSLKDLMKEVFTTGLNGDEKQKIKITPERFEKSYFNWIDNLRDWCISRQIWWGHRIPVYYRKLGSQKAKGRRQNEIQNSKTWNLKIYGQETFENLKNGTKKIETRAGKPKGSEKYWGDFKAGDVVEFYLADAATDTKIARVEPIKKVITKVTHFQTLEEMFANYKMADITTSKTIEEEKSWWQKIPGLYKRIEQYGIWAFELEETKNSGIALTFFRHTQTNSNKNGITMGRTDMSINNEGSKQAEEIAEKIKNKHFDLIFCSPLKRARETAEILFGKNNLKIDERLTEIDFGQLTGKSWSEADEYREAGFPGGESYSDVARRVNDFLAEIFDKYPGKRIAIVSHSNIWKVLENIINDQPLNINFLKQHAQLGPIEFNLSEIKYVGDKPPKGEGWEQDPDTLDTWFSSGLWTFSTLGWPEQTADLKKFHPTTWMQMGYEILFFWMARMILMSSYALRELPFREVYIHGILRDKSGKKFSKSAGNGIDPLEMCAKYGTDALRMSLISGVAPGNDAKFYEDKVVGFRNFANKIWNIGRFIQMAKQDVGAGLAPARATARVAPTTLADRWIMSRLNNVIKEVTGDFDNYRFSLAAEKLYEFAWHELADWYVEIAKKQGDDNTYQLLTNIYLDTLKLLHPFMPFITETIFQSFEADKMLMIEKWPGVDEKKINAQTEQDFKVLQDLVTAIRSWRKEKNIEPKEILKVQIAGGGNLVTEQKEVIDYLCRTEIESVEELAEFNLEVDEMKIRIMI
ncbi:MAG TPA: class I tRNA ligase family protein [Patescibacteria group bacterium]|nr:class I tRNA ligase family protein [Patescibacteria group bacterium]